jgi:hypothetical protein
MKKYMIAAAMIAAISAGAADVLEIDNSYAAYSTGGGNHRSADDYYYGHDNLQTNMTYNGSGLAKAPASSGHEDLIVVPHTIERIKHVEQIVKRIHYIDCSVGGGGENPTPDCSNLDPFYNWVTHTNTQGNNRFVYMYNFYVHLTESGGNLGGGSDVYAKLIACPLGNQEVYLHQDVWNDACGGKMMYTSVWKGGLKSYRKFWFTYIPTPCPTNN